MKTSTIFYIILITTLLSPATLPAQWIQTNGPYGGTIQCFTVSGTNLFAGTYGNGIFLSTNNGTSWIAVNTGLTNTYVYALAVSSAGDGTNLFAGTGGGVFLSSVILREHSSHSIASNNYSS